MSGLDTRFYDFAKRRVGTGVAIYGVVVLGIFIAINASRTQKSDCQARADIATIDLFLRESGSVKESVPDYLSDADSTGDLAFHFRKNFTRNIKVRTFDTSDNTLRGHSYFLSRYTDASDAGKNEFILKYVTQQLCGRTPPFSTKMDFDHENEEAERATLASFNQKENHYAFASKLITKDAGRIRNLRSLTSVFIGLRKMQEHGSLSKLHDFDMTFYDQVAFANEVPLDVSVQKWTSGLEGGNQPLWRISFRTDQFRIIDHTVAKIFRGLAAKFEKLGYKVCKDAECTGLPTGLLV